MESHAKAAGHAIHQQLIVFPLGLLATAVVFDILRLIVGRSGFAVASYYVIAAGVVGGLVAAVFGAIDYFAIPVAPAPSGSACCMGPATSWWSCCSR